MKYHLIGDQGVSMSGLRVILESSGHTVTGSDIKTGGHKQENVKPDTDFVIRTSAVSPGSPGWVEVERANELGIRVMKRSELIKEITKDKFLIAVSGMHGKTTVTSLIGLILEKAGLDPTVLVGEKIREFDNETARVGNSKYFVLEACEYDKSFLDFYPDVCVITNLDEEHLDTYPNGMQDIKEAFRKYLMNVKPDGEIIYYKDDENLVDVLRGVNIKTTSYESDSLPQNLIEKLAILGKHNVLNATAAALVAKNLGVSDEVIGQVFSTFKGAKRRLELWGEVRGAKVYDDYGHHPTEIAASIDALRDAYPGKKLLTIFWPHQYKRVAPLKEQFAEVLSKSDEVILKPIFFVPGRDEILDVSSEDIAEIINSKDVPAKVIENDEDIVREVEGKANEDIIILTIGIPPIYEVAKLLTRRKDG